MSEDEWRCRFAGSRKPNGNCELLEPDGFPAQGVGEWSPQKHQRLDKVIDATSGPRSRYVPAGPMKGGAAFVDLFAGPGLVRVANRPDVHRGSPLIALAHSKAPFTRVVLCDHDGENVAALRARTAEAAARTTIIHGDCNDKIGEIVTHIPPHGLNLAFLDPFGPKALRWATLAELAKFARMDLLVNVPIGFIKRNFHAPAFGEHLTAILGDDSWRAHVRSAPETTKIVQLLRDRLSTIGYTPERSRSIRITNSMNVPMFHLVFFSKHELGGKIWRSLATFEASGQKDFGFE
jgi:three-Cys-motif partner protein